MNAFFKALDKIIGMVTAAMLAVAFLLSVFGVYERYYVASSGTDWLLEVVVFGMVWAILLSVARIEHRRAHIRMDMVWRHFSNRGKVRAEYASLILGLIVSIIFVYSGYHVISEAMMWDERTDSSLRLPYWLYYSSFSTAFGIHILFVFHRLYKLSRNEIDFEVGDLAD